MSRPGARCRHCCWSVSPGRSPNPPCGSHRNGLSMVSAVGLFRQPGPKGWEQVVEPPTRIGHRPTVKLGLHLRYPPPRTHRHRVDEVVLGWGVTIRCRVSRHYSLQSLLETTAVLRHVTGSPSLGLLRRLRPVPDRSADGVPSPPGHDGDVDKGADQGRFPCSLVDRSTEEAPDSTPATSPWLPRSTSPRPPHPPADIRGVPRLRNEGDRCASPPAQIHQVRAGASLRGVNVGSSRMPFRHARHTRVVWQYRHAMALSGPLATHPGTSRDRLPPASPPRCDGTEAKVSHLHSINKRLTAHRRSDAGPGE
jgi:hypothetical protein